MANLLNTLRRSGSPLSFEEFQKYFTFNGLSYPVMSSGGTLGEKQENISGDYRTLVDAAYKSNGVVFAIMMVRQLLFSEARFQFRRRVLGRPGEMFGTRALSLLDEPGPGETTGKMLARMMQDTDLAGNWFGARRLRGGKPGIKRLRPDWVTMVLGSLDDYNADVGTGDIDAEVLGYIYKPGGPQSTREAVPLLVEDVAHYAPIPDPTGEFRGMSWLTPIIREIMGDQAMNTHKQKFMEQGATANMVVNLDADIKREEFEKWVELFEQSHGGIENAYKTLYLGAGSKAEVVGSDLRRIDFKQVQGGGETRMAAAGGTPPIIVGLSEGLESATYCLPFDERVWTLSGPKAIGEVRPGDQVWSSKDGRLRSNQVTWQGCVGTKDVYLVKTKNRELRATANHPVLTRVPGNSSGPNSERMASTEWRQVGDLKPGDYIIEAVGLPDLDEVPDGVTLDMAQWLGAYVGDGCGAGKGVIAMALPPSDRTRAFYERLSIELFGARITPGERSFRLVSCDAAQRVADWGFEGLAKTKRIPGWVFRLPLEYRLRFLAGLMDTDGSVDKRGVGGLGFANRELVEQARALFISCGISVSNVTYRKQLAENLPNPGLHESYDFWAFAITTNLGKVPTADPLYVERLKARKDAREGRHHQNPCLDPDAMGAFKVCSIELIGAEPVYDITVEGDHSFIAAGVAVHNSNYGRARRRFADGTMRPLWREAAGCLSKLVVPPNGSELWYDARDISFLQEDLKDQAEISRLESETIKTYVDAGYTPESAVASVNANDPSLLKHSGLLSVQLQTPGSGTETEEPEG